MMRKFLILLLFAVAAVKSFAQKKEISGLIYDVETKYRLSKVYIYNTHSQQGVMNNLLGEFSLEAAPGDVLIAASQGFAADTLKYENQKALIFKLKSLTIRLKEVNVKGIRKTPQQIYEGKLKSVDYALQQGNTDLFKGVSGMGLNIDALYNLISKQGRNARMLQTVLENDYRDAVIDYKYTPVLVTQITHLTDSVRRDDFMNQYRPGYFFILNASDYDLLNYIKMCYKSYLKNPTRNQPEDLPKLTLPKP